MCSVPLTTCPSCLRPTGADARFCGECGASLQVAPARPAPQPAGPAPTATPAPFSAGAAKGPAAGTTTGSGAMISLVLAAIGLVLCGPFTTIPGLVVAWRAHSAAKGAGQSTSLATIGLIANAVVTVLVLVGGGLMLLLMILSMAATA